VKRPIPNEGIHRQSLALSMHVLDIR